MKFLKATFLVICTVWTASTFAEDHEGLSGGGLPWPKEASGSRKASELPWPKKIVPKQKTPTVQTQPAPAQSKAKTLPFQKLNEFWVNSPEAKPLPQKASEKKENLTDVFKLQLTSSDLRHIKFTCEDEFFLSSPNVRLTGSTDEIEEKGFFFDAQGNKIPKSGNKNKGMGYVIRFPTKKGVGDCVDNMDRMKNVQNFAGMTAVIKVVNNELVFEEIIVDESKQKL